MRILLRQNVLIKQRPSAGVPIRTDLQELLASSLRLDYLTSLKSNIIQCVFSRTETDYFGRKDLSDQWSHGLIPNFSPISDAHLSGRIFRTVLAIIFLPFPPGFYQCYIISKLCLLQDCVGHSPQRFAFDAAFICDPTIALN